jgi:hypothetical protein
MQQKIFLGHVVHIEYQVVEIAFEAWFESISTVHDVFAVDKLQAFFIHSDIKISQIQVRCDLRHF